MASPSTAHLKAGQIKVLEESRETSFKKFLWQGVGQSPTALPLTLGGAPNERGEAERQTAPKRLNIAF